jgi:hypothetical protein
MLLLLTYLLTYILLTCSLALRNVASFATNSILCPLLVNFSILVNHSLHLETISWPSIIFLYFVHFNQMTQPLQLLTSATKSYVFYNSLSSLDLFLQACHGLQAFLYV